ncbi:hypothetical protein FB107DRAFT_288190 [Schizophyllum commune]
MLLPPPGLAPPSQPRSRVERPRCIRDIRVTYISLLAPFYKLLDDCSGRSHVRQPSRRSPTPLSRSVATPRSRQSTLASPSCASTTNGPKKRPCIVANVGQTSADICVLGTFEGAFIDRIHEDLQPHLAILVSRKSKHKGDWLESSGMRHMHSSPEWYQAKGNVQYIVPLLHQVDLDDIKDRWSVHACRKVDGDQQRTTDHSAVDSTSEGYYMDQVNLYHITNCADDTTRGLKHLFRDRAYRRKFRRMLDKKMVTIKTPTSDSASVITFDSYAPSIHTVLSQAKATSVTENIPSACDESSNWRSAVKRISTTLSMTSTSSRSTASKRHFEYDDECPRTPKAAKQELDASSMRSKGSTRSIPFKRSSKANTPQSPVASRNK